MPFCPECKYEYREGTETCPDCDLSLVAELQEEPQGGCLDSELVVVGRFRFVSEAEMARLRLDSSGIQAVVMDTVSPSLYVGFAVMNQGVRLMTRAEDADRARKILSED